MGEIVNGQSVMTGGMMKSLTKDYGMDEQRDGFRSVRVCIDERGWGPTSEARTEQVGFGGDEELVSHAGSLQTVDLQGVLDLGTSAGILSRLVEQLDKGSGVLVVEVSGVRSINTTGVLVLDAAERYARSIGRTMVVERADAVVRGAIEAVGLGRLFLGGSSSVAA